MSLSHFTGEETGVHRNQEIYSKSHYESMIKSVLKPGAASAKAHLLLLLLLIPSISFPSSPFSSFFYFCSSSYCLLVHKPLTRNKTSMSTGFLKPHQSR